MLRPLPLPPYTFSTGWSIRYRLVYPDDDFRAVVPTPMTTLTRSERGRDLIERLARSRLFGPILYRYWSLPLTVLARKPPAR